MNAQPPWANTTTVLSVLEQIAREANSGQQPREVLDRIVSAVTQHGPWNICWAGLVDINADQVVVYADSGFAEHAPPPPFEEWIASETPSWQAIEAHTPFVLSDALRDERFPLVQSDADLRDFRSVLIIPLYVGEEVGAIWFCTRHPRTFSEDEIAFAEVVASLTSVALSNAAYQRRQQSLLEQEREQKEELRRLNDLADRQYHDLQRLSQTRAALLEELVREGGIEGLIAVVVDSLGTAALVIDRFGNLLAVHGFADPVDEEVPEAIAVAMKGQRGVLPQEVTVKDAPLTVCPIDSGDTRLGYLCCTVEAATLDAVARELLTQAALHMALELVKDRVRLESHTRVFGDFVAALSSVYGDSLSVERAATAAGITVRRPIRVFRGRLTLGHGAQVDDLLLFSRQLHRLISPPFTENVIIPAGPQDLLMLVQWPGAHDPRDFTAELRRCLKRARRMVGGSPSEAPEILLTVGMGPVAVGIPELRVSEKEARQCLEVATAMGKTDIDVDLRSLGSYSLLTSLDPAENDAFVDRYLGEVRAYDQRHGSELEATITAYLDAGGSIAKTAAELHVHASTLKYRIRRVHELTGMSLSDPEHRLCFALAARMARLHHGGNLTAAWT